LVVVEEEDLTIEVVLTIKVAAAEAADSSNRPLFLLPFNHILLVEEILVQTLPVVQVAVVVIQLVWDTPHMVVDMVVDMDLAVLPVDVEEVEVVTAAVVDQVARVVTDPAVAAEAAALVILLLEHLAVLVEIIITDMVMMSPMVVAVVDHKLAPVLSQVDQVVVDQVETLMTVVEQVLLELMVLVVAAVLLELVEHLVVEEQVL
tara:strand:+ start:124 stop:735 length:612 start_codon:yes stop_codon:yes gene_type:complete